jgi:hypothetical protein
LTSPRAIITSSQPTEVNARSIESELDFDNLQHQMQLLQSYHYNPFYGAQKKVLVLDPSIADLVNANHCFKSVCFPEEQLML